MPSMSSKGLVVVLSLSSWVGACSFFEEVIPRDCAPNGGVPTVVAGPAPAPGDERDPRGPFISATVGRQTVCP